MSDPNLDAAAPAVFAANRYMVLGTADADGRPWTIADVTAPARHRLYRATVTEQWVLGPRDERLPVTAL